MKVIVQRARNAQVTVNNQIVGAIDYGLMLLVGVTHDDNQEDVQYLADKIVNLRIFEDEEEKMNLSLLDVQGSVLSISQFTLYADTKKGRRPSYINAARPEVANQWYEQLNEAIREKGVTVETGTFGAMMDVQFINEGPVTIILESEQRKA